jgi:hypothetical protein
MSPSYADGEAGTRPAPTLGTTSGGVRAEATQNAEVLVACLATSPASPQSRGGAPLHKHAAIPSAARSACIHERMAGQTQRGAQIIQRAAAGIGAPHRMTRPSNWR